MFCITRLSIHIACDYFLFEFFLVLRNATCRTSQLMHFSFCFRVSKHTKEQCLIFVSVSCEKCESDSCFCPTIIEKWTFDLRYLRIIIYLFFYLILNVSNFWLVSSWYAYNYELDSIFSTILAQVDVNRKMKNCYSISIFDSNFRPAS